MKCPNCGLEEHNEYAEYCEECGIFLTNLCTNDCCDLNNGDSVPLSPTAKYCYSCGNESTFNELGFFDKE